MLKGNFLCEVNVKRTERKRPKQEIRNSLFISLKIHETNEQIFLYIRRDMMSKNNHPLYGKV